MSTTTADSTADQSLARPLIGWGAAVLAVAVIGGLATNPGSDWYEQLDKPSWQPPGSVFGPVWTALYVLLAISAALAFRDVRGPRRRLVLGLYAANLALNLGWSVIFFRLERPLPALIEMIPLLGTIIALIVLVRRHNAVAAGALVPYAAWVSYATALTGSIAANN